MELDWHAPPACHSVPEVIFATSKYLRRMEWAGKVQKGWALKLTNVRAQMSRTGKVGKHRKPAKDPTGLMVSPQTKRFRNSYLHQEYVCAGVEWEDGPVRKEPAIRL